MKGEEPPKTWQRAKTFMHDHSALFHGLAFETRLKIQNAVDVLIHRAIEEDRFAISCRFLRENNQEAADTVDALTDP